MIVVAADAAGEFAHLMQRRDGVMHCADDETQPPEKIRGRESGDMSSEGLAKARQGWVKFPDQQLVLEWRWFGQASAQHPEEISSTAGAAAKLEHRAGHNLQHLAQGNNPARGRRLGFFQLSQPCFIQRPQAAGEHELIKSLLVAQVVVSGSEINPGLAGYFAQGGGLKAVKSKTLFS